MQKPYVKSLNNYHVVVKQRELRWVRTKTPSVKCPFKISKINLTQKYCSEIEAGKNKWNPSTTITTRYLQTQNTTVQETEMGKEDKD